MYINRFLFLFSAYRLFELFFIFIYIFIAYFVCTHLGKRVIHGSPLWGVPAKIKILRYLLLLFILG